MQDQDLALDDSDNVFGMMAAVRHLAAQMVKREAHRKWRLACGQIISATRRAEELLQPFLLVEVLPEGSDAFTHRTNHSHSQAPPRGSATAVTGSTAEETRTQGDPEAFNFPEVIPGGETEAKMQALEHHLLELQNTHDHNDHSDIAATLHALGDWSRHAGDLTQAKQYFDESLRMYRSLHGDRDHPDALGIAATLNALGNLSRHAGDLKQAKKYFNESLRMNRSLHGDRDHPDIAATLHALGDLSRRAGDLKQAKKYLEETLRMYRSLHGDRDHHDVAVTLHALGNVSQLAGDLNQAEQYFDESLRMYRSLHGDRDHHDVAVTLHELGNVSQLAGDLNQAEQYFDESLRMKRSLHGDRDHPDIAATLHELGNVSLQAGDLKQAKKYYDESLRMDRSLHGHRDHPDIAATLHALGNLSRRAGDLKQAKKYLEESLRMYRSLHGDRALSEIAATLHELGKLALQTGDLKRSELYSDQYRIMQYAVDRDKGLSVMSASLLQWLHSVAWRYMWQLLWWVGMLQVFSSTWKVAKAPWVGWFPQPSGLPQALQTNLTLLLQSIYLGSFGSSQIKIRACSCGVAPLAWMLPCFSSTCFTMFHPYVFFLPLPTRSSLKCITAQDPSWSGKRAHHLRQAWPAMNECSYWILLVGLGRRVNSLSH